jgi:hypothetical protein
MREPLEKILSPQAQGALQQLQVLRKSGSLGQKSLLEDLGGGDFFPARLPRFLYPCGKEAVLFKYAEGKTAEKRG